MLSYVTAGERDVLILTPMAVRPDRQRAGVGKQVVRAAIAAADARGEPVLLVEGVPSYYPQFGFRSASELGFERPDPRIPEARLDGAAAGAPRIRRSRRPSSTRLLPAAARMPELPEVESVRRAIAPALEGRRLEHVEIDDVRLTRPEDPLEVAAELTGERVEHVDRRGKYLIVRFASGRALLIHLRMTGSLAAGARRDVARPRRAPARRRQHGRLPRRAAVRHLAPARAGRARAVPRRAARRGAARRRVHGEGSRRAAGGPPCAAEGGAARPADARRAREHLRRRGALVREAPSAASGGLARARPSCAGCTARSGRRSSSGSPARARRSPTTASRTAPPGRCRRSSGPTAAPTSRATAAARRSRRRASAAAAPGSARRVSRPSRPSNSLLLEPRAQRRQASGA